MNLGRTLAVSMLMASLAATSSFAKDKLIDENGEERIVEILNDMGYEARTRSSKEGRRVIDFEVDGVPVAMFLNNCAHDVSCGVATLSAGYDLEDGVDPAKLIEWNGDKLFATAYADAEADPFIDMTVNLRFGVSEANFRDTIDWWRVIKSEFEAHIEYFE